MQESYQHFSCVGYELGGCRICALALTLRLVLLSLEVGFRIALQ